MSTQVKEPGLGIRRAKCFSCYKNAVPLSLSLSLSLFLSISSVKIFFLVHMMMVCSWRSFNLDVRLVMGCRSRMLLKTFQSNHLAKLPILPPGWFFRKSAFPNSAILIMFDTIAFTIASCATMLLDGTDPRISSEAGAKTVKSA